MTNIPALFLKNVIAFRLHFRCMVPSSATVMSRYLDIHLAFFANASDGFLHFLPSSSFIILISDDFSSCSSSLRFLESKQTYAFTLCLAPAKSSSSSVT